MENTNELQPEEIILDFALKGCESGCEYLIEFLSKDCSIQFQTEKIKSISNNSLIEFSKSLRCKYFFYKIQYVEVNILKWKSQNCFIKNRLKPNYPLTLSTIISSDNSVFQYKIKEKIPNSENLIIRVNTNINNSDFVDYLKAGIKINSYIGIDFSNKEEHILALKENQYIKCVSGLREALFGFVRNFEVYGYGANILNPEINNPGFFNLSLNENPNLKGLTEISNAYNNCLNNINFSENNNILSPLLKHIGKRIYEKKELMKYNIFFLLIRKSPKNEDFQNCIDFLIENSHIPLSIIIIGIGDDQNEFNNIKDLYNNQIHSNGIKKLRNNIFFISMKECNFDGNILKNICLKEIPNQMVEFYKLIKTTIDDIKMQNLEKINNSLKILDIANRLCKDNKNLDPPPPIKDLTNQDNYNDNNNNIKNKKFCSLIDYNNNNNNFNNNNYNNNIIQNNDIINDLNPPLIIVKNSKKRCLSKLKKK